MPKWSQQTQFRFAEDGQQRNRVEELAAYAKSQGLGRIGIAFCVSLTKEAQKLGKSLRERGLETELVCCRVGAIDYDEIGLPKAHPERFSAICSPVAQAKLLNLRKVDLVAQVGLCIGHDLIFQRECEAPVTTDQFFVASDDCHQETCHDGQKHEHAAR